MVNRTQPCTPPSGFFLKIFSEFSYLFVWLVVCVWLKISFFVIDFNRIPAAVAHVGTMAHVRLDSPVKAFVASVTRDSLEQTVMKVWLFLANIAKLLSNTVKVIDLAVIALVSSQ